MVQKTQTVFKKEVLQEIMPNDPEKIIQYVIILFPGFISMALLKHLSDVPFTDFEFVFSSVLVSLIVYFISRSLAQFTVFALPEVTFLQSVGWLFTIVIPVSFLAGVFMSDIYEKDVIINFAKGIALTEHTKSSKDRPLLMVMRRWESKDFGELDERGIIHEESKKIRKKYWARVHVKSVGAYEGLPRFFPTAGNPDEFYLSPACKIVGKDRATEKFIPLNGAGLFVASSNTIAIEFVDTPSSKCNKMIEKIAENLNCKKCPLGRNK